MDGFSVARQQHQSHLFNDRNFVRPFADQLTYGQRMSDDQPRPSDHSEIARILGVLEDLRRQDREENILKKTYTAMGVGEDDAEAQAVRNLLEQHGEGYLVDLAVALYYDDAGERATFLATVDPKLERVAYFNHRSDGCKWAAESLRHGFNQPALREEFEPPISREEAAKLGRQAANGS